MFNNKFGNVYCLYLHKLNNNEGIVRPELVRQILKEIQKASLLTKEKIMKYCAHKTTLSGVACWIFDLIARSFLLLESEVNFYLYKILFSQWCNYAFQHFELLQI